MRDFAVFADGRPVSRVEPSRVGDVPPIEALATDAAFRGRGHASRVVVRALHAAREDGATLVFLCTDAADGSRHLDRRLGFDDLGRSLTFTRHAS